MAVPTSKRLLVADHRGLGLQNRLRPLAAMGFVLEPSPGLGETLRHLERQPPDLVVLDPLARGGTAELERLRAGLGDPGTPVLLVADGDDPLATVLTARVLGERPFDLVYRGAPTEELLLRIERLLGQAERLAELEDARYAATHDDLTGLLRAGSFQARLVEHFSAAQRHHLDMALVLVDLDRFGAVNKEFDHTVGDRVIARVGKVIAEFLRAEDVAGRLGGDEFGLVLPYTQRVDAARVVGRIRDQVETLSGPQAGGAHLRVAASIGFETFDGADLESVGVLRRHAEVSLRHAKQQGGNRAVYYRSLEASGAVESPGRGDEALGQLAPRSELESDAPIEAPESGR